MVNQENPVNTQQKLVQIDSTLPLKTGRIHAMDSLRGLASFQVLIHHALGMSIFLFSVLKNPQPIASSFWTNLFTFSPIHIFWAGHEAVIFFFVMSGFVLSIPYYKNKGGSYLSFFVKRVFRIYVPYLIAIVIGLTLNSIFLGHGTMPSLSKWANAIFTKDYSAREIVALIIYLKGDFPKLVTSLWSLPVEIKISFIFPFVVIIVKRLSIPLTLILPVINMLFYHLGKKIGLQDIWNEFALFYYFSFFLFGAALSKYQHLLLPVLNRLNRKVLLGLLLTAIILYTYSWNIVWFPQPIFALLKKIPSDYVVAIAALLLIIISATNTVGKLLTNRCLEELGKISFSLYLIHPMIMGIIAIVLGNTMPSYLIIILSIVFSILLAFPFHYWIEWPLQKLGRRLGDRIIKEETIVQPT